MQTELIKDKEKLVEKLSEILKISPKSLFCHLTQRLGILFDEGDSFIIEEYTERKWKELFKLAYIDSSSVVKNSKINPVKVLRIHICKGDEYLGFFTLRPLKYTLISTIYPNFNYLNISKLLQTRNENVEEKIYILGYTKKVHLLGKSFEIFTFPYFQQDSLVTICAHANILMLGEYLFNKKFLFSLPTIEQVISSFAFAKPKLIPSDGLNIFQILEICSNINIPVKFESLSIIRKKIRKRNKGRNEEKEIIDLLEKNYEPLIHFFIDSELPVILGIDNHVILLIGHVISSDNERRYIIYDDSGALTAKCRKVPSFIDIVDIFHETFVKKLKYIIYPEPERFYINILTVREILNNWDFLKDIGLKEISRTFIIDNSKLKSIIWSRLKMKKMQVYSLFSSNSVPEEIVKSFVYEDKPHFLVLIECKKGKEFHYLILNPTYCITKNNYSSLKEALYNIVLKTSSHIGNLKQIS